MGDKKKIRKEFGLTEREHRVLAAESSTLGIDMAELIRRILDKHIDLYLEKNPHINVVFQSDYLPEKQ